jgi:hypothetical protein
MLQVNTFLFKPEAVRSYWLPKAGFPKNAFKYFALSLCNNFYNNNNYINYNVMINEDVWLMASRPDFAAQYSHGHAKEFIRKLSTIWARAYEKVRQPCSGYMYNRNGHKAVRARHWCGSLKLPLVMFRTKF